MKTLFESFTIFIGLLLFMVAFKGDAGSDLVYHEGKLSAIFTLGDH